MTTPERPGGVPAEATLAEQQVPRPTETPTTGLPSPGVGPAQTRMPIGPTLPDWDSTGFAGALGRALNDLFVPAAPHEASAGIAPVPPSLAIPEASRPGASPTAASPG